LVVGHVGGLIVLMMPHVMRWIVFS
jgi:hypothetical protein